MRILLTLVQIKKMNWHEYPILRLLLPLILGIVFYINFPSWSPLWLINILFLIITGFLSWPKKYLFPYKHRYISGLIIYASFIFLGISLAQFNFPYSGSNYYGEFVNTSNYGEGLIIEPPEIKPKSIKIIIEVTHLKSDSNTNSTNGIAVLYLEKGSRSEALQYGDVIIFENSLDKIRGPDNPDEFDYQSYLYNSGIKYQAYLRGSKWKDANVNRRNILKSLAFHARNSILNELQKHNINNEEFSVAAAMLLGVRSHLSPELRQSFSGAGAMHILCVSGLHVGIIFMLLKYFLSFMDRMKQGRLIRSIIILACIWSYAMITGLSPSVVRAATMFSFISIGQNIGRQVNIYNSLAASAFVLLVFNPFLILDVGFQLSYSAVIAIVTLQQPIQSLWTPESRYIFPIWKLTTVSLAAQIGTAPIAMFYFHSFPNYFLLTNLIVIPAAFIIFITGIAVLLFSWAGPLADYVGWLLSWFIRILNYFITSIEGAPYAVSSDIYISPVQLIILLFLSVSISIVLVYRKPKALIASMVIGLLFLLAPYVEPKKSAQFIVYQTAQFDYISFIQGHNEYGFVNRDVLDYPEIVDYQSKEHRIKYGIKARQLFDLDEKTIISRANLFRENQFIGFDSIRIAVVSSDFVSSKYDGSIEINYLIITGNPKVSIASLCENYRCNNLIFTASNAPWNIKKWKVEVDKLEIAAHYVKEDGAFVLNIY